jgi:hypothetical protein
VVRIAGRCRPTVRDLDDAADPGRATALRLAVELVTADVTTQKVAP